MDPYIGITGFMTTEEVETVLGVFPEDSSRKLMVGVLGSEKTMMGQPNNWPNRYPDRKMVEYIFSDNPLALNLVHYNTKNSETIAMQIGIFADIFGGPNFHGFQLNIAWPSPKELLDYRTIRKARNPLMTQEDTIVLQIGGHAFNMVDNSPQKLAEKVQEYKGLVDYLLLDPSGGKGQPFGTEKAREYLRALRDKDLGIGLGVAGGLSAETLHLIEPLIEEFPDLSMDAECLIRDEDDNLDLENAKWYVSATLEMFS